MEGLVDAEYLWEPVPNCLTVRPNGESGFRWDGPAQDGDARVFTTLAWRLTHIADALAGLDRADATGSAVLAGTTEESLSRPMGEIDGPFGSDTRRSFVLHTVDELMHHGAECGLLRDLYAAAPLI